MTEAVRVCPELERTELASFYKEGDIVVYCTITGNRKVGVVHHIEQNLVQVRFWLGTSRRLAFTPTKVLPYRIVRIGWVE